MIPLPRTRLRLNYPRSMVFKSPLFSRVIDEFAFYLQINNSEINGDLENMYRKTILSLLQPSWMINELIRNKRNERLVEEIPTKHAKHRKRRRYRNRSTCVESTSGSKLSLRQDNNTMPLDIHISKETKKNRDENNTVLEIEEELDDISIGVNDRVQVIIGDGDIISKKKKNK